MRCTRRKHLRQGNISSLMKQHERTGVTLGEYPTITALHEHCTAEVNAGRQGIVFYMHLKSAHMKLKNDSIAQRNTAQPFWREAMNTFNLEFSSICLRALLRGSSACGSLYRHAPTSHFAGNFFWASCNHIAQLAPLPSPVSDFEASEFFLMRTGDVPAKTIQFATKCSYEVLSLKKRFYKEPIKPSEYMYGIRSMLTNKNIPNCGLNNTGFLCLRDGMLDDKRPCLSLLTPPDPSLHNYYNISFNNITTFRWK